MDFRTCSNVRAERDIRQEFLPVIQSQYSASFSICAIINGLWGNVNPRADIDMFFKNYVDIDTAAGVGLDVLGNILDRDRRLHDRETGYFEKLNDEDYRWLLKYKALANICASDAKTLNMLLQRLHEGETVYVIEMYDKGPMHIRYIFDFFLTERQFAMFKEVGLLCKGAGVGFDFYTIPHDEVFGFDGSGLAPFDCGVFDPYGIQTMNTDAL